MQSNKTSSRKPRETAASSAGELPEGNTKAPVKKARNTAAAASTSKSSKAAGSATRHRKAASSAGDTVEVPNNEISFNETAVAKTAPKTMAAVSGAGTGASGSDVIESVGNAIEPRMASREEIAALAHSYWLERGGEHGSHEEDWLRAEQELRSR